MSPAKKVLLIESEITGHHLTYIQALEKVDAEVAVILPKPVTGCSCKSFVVPNYEEGRRSFSGYRRWLKEVNRVVREYHPDTVHFLYGDALYKYFGYGLWYKNRYNAIVTVHSVRDGFLNTVSFKRIAGRMSKVVVHSGYLKKAANKKGAQNVVHIEYPCFNREKPDPAAAKAGFGLPADIPVLGCIGGTRRNKGLDILLEALKQVKQKVVLFVAGRAQDFDEDYIRGHLPDDIQAQIAMRNLSDTEFAQAVSASDFIVLPYRKSFNGASGPLGEGVYRGKCIIGPDCGNLGATIRENHLGFVFAPEDPEDLAKTIDRSVSQPFEKDEKYRSYQVGLDVESFVKAYNQIY